MSTLSLNLSPSLPAPSLTPPRASDGTSPSAFEEQARQQAEQFEASFIASLLQPVFENLAKNQTFGGGFAEETFSGLLTQEYAKEIAGSSSLGIAEAVYRQLIDAQENGSASDLIDNLDALYSPNGTVEE